MNKEKMVKRIGAGILAGFLAITMLPVEAFDAAPNHNNRITHGTSSTIVTEDMLDTEIPADYKVNEATQGKAEEGE